MTVFAVAYVIVRPSSEDENMLQFHPFLQIAGISGTSPAADVVAKIQAYFHLSDQAKDGWKLFSEPVVFELHRGVVDSLQPFLHYPIALPPPGSHLRVVK